MPHLILKTLISATIAGSILAMPVAQAAETRSIYEALFGVNLAGAEFGGNVLPGAHGTNYVYPTDAALDYYQSKGRILIRLPFKWERMQRSLNGPLDADELGRLRGVLRAAGRRKMKVILDVHNYGRYHFIGEKAHEIIGSPRVPYAAFANFWSKLAAAVKDEPGVYGYGLMNEPHDMEDATRWPRAAQAAIEAIRRVDRNTAIVVPGDDWSSAKRWRSGSNEKLNETVRDPQSNLIFEAHCYFDQDGSGSYKRSYDEEGASPDVSIENVRPFVEWCREKGVHGLIGEYGVPDTDTRWLVAMDRFLTYLQANGISSTYWAGGPWWGKYALSIEPGDARESSGPASTRPDRPQMLILRQYPLAATAGE
jgi:endoglucanase